MRRIEGGCHCGNIAYVLTWPEAGEIPTRACSCTFCTGHGSVYTSHPQAGLEATVGDGSALSRYRFGTGTADFFVCRNCGMVPFVTSEIDGCTHAVVNVNTFSGGAERSRQQPAITNFDGETTEGRLARRSRTWIRTVRITVQGS